MSAKATKIMLVGLGDLGGVLLDLLLRSGKGWEIVVAARNAERAAPRFELARLAALAQGCPSQARLVRLDLNDVAAAAETIYREQPDVLLSTATMATWWLPDLLPEQDAKAIRSAGFGVWIPVHLAPTLRLMRAVKQAQYPGFVLTAPYPDVVNHALGKVGLAPTCGVGNVAEMVPKVLQRAACALNCSTRELDVRMVAHHALGKFVYADSASGQSAAVPRFLLEIERGGRNIAEEVDVREMVLAGRPIAHGRATHLLTAGSAMPLMEALLQEKPVALHAPAPHGLPGGYPVTVSRAGVELRLGMIPLADAIRVNESSQVFDGIGGVLEDGTVELVEENARQLESLLGECPRRITIADVEEQAEDLVARYQAFAARRGAISA